jgi:hypothetical protein
VATYRFLSSASLTLGYRISSHTAIMDMEMQFLHESFLGKGPKLLVDHIRRMGSGEAPLFATTLSLVYEKLFEKTVAQSVASGPGLGKSDPAVGPTFPQASIFTFPAFSWPSNTASSGSQPSVSTPVPIPPPPTFPTFAWAGGATHSSSQRPVPVCLRFPKCSSRPKAR